MLCNLLKECVLKIKNIDQPGRDPVFKSISGSVQDPGQFGSISYGQSISAYEVFTVPADRIFVLEHASAVVTRGDAIPYPSDNMNDYGAVGYELDTGAHFHSMPFIRSEPGGVLQASMAIRIYIPSNARVVVKVPLVENQSGGSEVNVSGYYLST
ncbi:MAG: hypothetical protein ABW098_08115 [Candidatus Thiodiazotropha sp.]